METHLELPLMDQADITRKLQDHFGDRLLSTFEHRGQHAVSISPDELVAMMTYLRDDAELDFSMLMDIGGVDYLDYGKDSTQTNADGTGPRFAVVYHLLSVSHNHRLRVVVRLEDAGRRPAAPTHDLVV